MVANGETVIIIGQVVIPIMDGKDVNHVSFRLLPKLKSTSIFGTDMIKCLKMTLNYDTETWWLSGSLPSRYHKPNQSQKTLHRIVERRQKLVMRVVTK